jgi:hypothetical protein
MEPRLTPVFGTFWCRAELIAHTHRLLFEQHRANVRIAVYDGEDVPETSLQLERLYGLTTVTKPANATSSEPGELGSDNSPRWTASSVPFVLAYPPWRRCACHDDICTDWVEDADRELLVNLALLLITVYG